MATIKTIKMFDENGILTPEALLIINDSAFLAEMAYENREKLKEVSLNPDAKDDEIIIIQNPDTGTKFEVVEVYEGSNGLNLSTFKKESSSEYFFAGAGTDDGFDYIADTLYLLSGKNIQSAEAISKIQSEIKKISEKDPDASYFTAAHSLAAATMQEATAVVDEISLSININALGGDRGIKSRDDFNELQYYNNADKIYNINTFLDPVTFANKQYGNHNLELKQSTTMINWFDPKYRLGQHSVENAREVFKDAVGEDFMSVNPETSNYKPLSNEELEGLANMINNGDNSALLYPKNSGSDADDSPNSVVDTLLALYLLAKGKYDIAKALIDKSKQSGLFDKLVANLGDFVVNGHSLGGDTLNASLYDPIALDLNANGKIDTLSLENGVFFDHNGDEIAFKSSWISGDDGILARDINGDNEINNGAELFGNFTKLKNGQLAKNGAEALKDLDDNNDGLFDESDKAFNEILVWQDFNSNGKAESDELKTLGEHGIKSINLEFLDDNTALDKDNKQILVGSFSINDSDNALASDIDFSVNTIEREMAESAGLIKGTGFVRDFKPELSKEIKSFYAKYKELASKAEQISATDELVALWAKTAKQYKELDNPIQKVKINISSVASNTTSSAKDELIKRAEAGEITLSEGVMRDGRIITGSNAGASKISA